MSAMNIFLPMRFDANRFEFPPGRPIPAIERTLATERPLLLRLRHALAGRRWRRAPPFEGLSDHLRRDIGLPPLDPDSPRRYRR